MTTPAAPFREPASPGNEEPLQPEGTPPNQGRPFLRSSELKPAFWTITGALSLAVNIILIVILLILGSQFFKIKTMLGDQLINGLYENFVKMDQAHIVSTIEVNDTIWVKDSIPVVFPLRLKQETTVVLTRDTPIRRATVFLNGVAVPTDLILRQGTKLDIYLDLTVPVSQTIPVELKVPVSLKVPVDIPLAETELHTPFDGLQQVIAPYKNLFDQLPSSWGEMFCGALPDTLCK